MKISKTVRVILWVLTAAMLLTIPVLWLTEKKFSYTDAKKSVVRVLAITKNGSGTGTAFPVGSAGDDTVYFVTNRHVVYDESAKQMCSEVYLVTDDSSVHFNYIAKVTVTANNEAVLGDWYVESKQIDYSRVTRCEVLYPDIIDPEYPDVAILKAKVPIKDHPALRLKKSASETDGRNVYAIGYPSSADEYNRPTSVNWNTFTAYSEEDLVGSPEAATITEGLFSRKLRFAIMNDTYVVQHTAHINHGNSGGPLVNDKGEVVGINTYGAGADSDSGYAEYSLSVYTEYVIRELDALGIKYDKAETVNIRVWLSAALGVAALGLAALLILSSSGKGKAHATAYNGDVSADLLRLVGVTGVYSGRRFDISEGVYIGRDPQRCNLAFPADTKGVSGLHCRLYIANGALWLEDCNSSYGTFLRGAKLTPGVPMRLSCGDSFCLGSPENSFRIDISSQA